MRHLALLLLTFLPSFAWAMENGTRIRINMPVIVLMLFPLTAIIVTIFLVVKTRRKPPTEPTSSSTDKH